MDSPEPLARLCAQYTFAFYTFESINNRDGEGRGAVFRGGEDYSLGWALTNYLYKRRRAGLAVYLRALGAQSDSAAGSPATRRRDFERVFGPMDDAFVGKFQHYMRQLQVRCGVPAGAPRR